MKRAIWAAGLVGLVVAIHTAIGLTQPPRDRGDRGGPGFGGPGGVGGPPGMGEERKLVKEHDRDGNGWLDAAERKTARAAATAEGGGPRGFGPKGGPGMKGGKAGRAAPKPGPQVPVETARAFPDAPLYDPNVLRTLFFEFDSPDWERELEDFHGTDVDVPARLTVDGKTYPNVGVRFRGMSSYGMVPAGSKRSLNVALDLADPKQRLYGHKTLNLLNAHEDPSLLSTVLYSHVARQYIPAPKANFVRVVINGECWGVYPSVQQFNKEFLAENYKTDKGARWKVRGSPGGGGGLDYVGDRVEDYKRRYEIKSADSDKSWRALIQLCKVLSETPPDRLEAALSPILDIEGVLWFLALDVALVNNDGYWVRASDYSLYQDPAGKFHVVPHDMNEAFKAGGGGPPGFGGPPGGFGGMFGGPRPPAPGEVLPGPLQDMLELSEAQRQKLAALQKDVDARLAAVLDEKQRERLKALRESGPFGGLGGPGGGGRGPGGGRGGPGGGGVTLDPLVALEDARKPLRSKLLAVPALRAKYLANVRAVAEKSLDWKSLGPVVAQFRGLIDAEVAADTRKLDGTEEFRRATADGPGAGLRAFADQRRAFLLAYREVKTPSR